MPKLGFVWRVERFFRLFDCQRARDRAMRASGLSAQSISAGLVGGITRWVFGRERARTERVKAEWERRGLWSGGRVGRRPVPAGHCGGAAWAAIVTNPDEGIIDAELVF